MFDPLSDSEALHNQIYEWGSESEYSDRDYERHLPERKVSPQMVRDIMGARIISPSDFISILEDGVTDEERNSIKRISGDIRTHVYLRKYCKCAINKRAIKRREQERDKAKASEDRRPNENESDLEEGKDEEEISEEGTEDRALNGRKYDESLVPRRYGAFCALANHIIEMFVKRPFARPDEKQNICFIRNHPYNLTLLGKCPISPSIVVLDAEHRKARRGKWRRYNKNGPPQSKEPWYWIDVKFGVEIFTKKENLVMTNPEDIRTYALSKANVDIFERLVKRVEGKGGYDSSEDYRLEDDDTEDDSSDEEERQIREKCLRRKRTVSESYTKDTTLFEYVAYKPEKLSAIKASISKVSNTRFQRMIIHASKLEKNDAGDKLASNSDRSDQRGQGLTKEDVRKRNEEAYHSSAYPNEPVTERDRNKFLDRTLGRNASRVAALKKNLKRRTAVIANHQLVSSFNRSHVIYLLVSDERLTLAFYSRQGITYSRSFDFVNNLEVFVRLLVAMNRQTEEDLGFLGKLTRVRAADKSPYLYTGVAARGDVIKWTHDDGLELMLGQSLYTRLPKGLNDKATRVFMVDLPGCSGIPELPRDNQVPVAPRRTGADGKGSKEGEGKIQGSRDIIRNRHCMAIGLHEHNSSISQSLERYDLESLFRSILWTAEIIDKGKFANTKLYQDVDELEKELDDGALSNRKKETLSKPVAHSQVTDTFTPLIEDWINPLRERLDQGYTSLEAFRKHRVYRDLLLECDPDFPGPRSPDPWPYFDVETLDGKVDYESFCEILRE